MNLEMTHVDVWSTEIDDQPGGLALKLRAMADYGTDLDCVIARREANKAGRGLVFISPLSDREPMEKADEAGFRRVTNIATLRVEGDNSPGMGAKLARTVADVGVNLHGFSAMAAGKRFICYLGFDSIADRDKAEAALRSLGGHRDWHFWRRNEKTSDVGAPA